MLSERIQTRVMRSLISGYLNMKPLGGVRASLPAARDPQQASMLYVHVPFCEQLCPEHESVQRALLLCMGLTEKGIGRRAALRRLEITCDALLSMAYGIVPRERPHFLNSCSYVGDAASRILFQWQLQWQQV